VHDELNALRSGYPKPVRQLCIRDLGHEEPTILLTIDTRSTPRTLIERYARRMLIENALEDQVHFFHFDALYTRVDALKTSSPSLGLFVIRSRRTRRTLILADRAGLPAACRVTGLRVPL
jgi:hypothetical protein